MDSYHIKRMNQYEVNTAIDWAQGDWAAKEGWNPGLEDAACFYQTDPNGKLNGKIIAVGSAVIYDDFFVFCGFYIVGYLESFYEYGSRVGIWRLLQLFDHHKIPLTFFVTGYALILNPLFSEYLASNTHEIAGHGWRWIDYSKESKATEKKHIKQCIDTIKSLDHVLYRTIKKE